MMKEKEKLTNHEIEVEIQNYDSDIKAQKLIRKELDKGIEIRI